MLPAFLYEEPEAHDINRLPHMREDIEIEKLFPLIKAAPPQINDDDWQPEIEKHDDKAENVGGSPRHAVRAPGKTRGRRQADEPSE